MRTARAEKPMPKNSPMSHRIGIISTGNPILDRIAMKIGVVPQMPRIVADIRPAPGKPSRKVGTRAKYGKVGRLNGMPWNGAASIEQSTDLDNGPKKPIKKPSISFEQKIINAWKSPKHGVSALMRLSREVRPYSEETADDLLWLSELLWNLAVGG